MSLRDPADPSSQQAAKPQQHIMLSVAAPPPAIMRTPVPGRGMRATIHGCVGEVWQLSAVVANGAFVKPSTAVCT